LKKKRVPMRMCLGCREMRPKKELIRVVKNKQGDINIDFIGKMPGRGAYICRDVSCFRKARKGKGLERAFETPIQEEIFQELERQLEDANGE
jgi:predicted RNA-binding protein YlxR (DUF448 family)